MVFTTLWANDNWPTSRTTINGNFVDAQTQLDTKVDFTGTVPAVGDLAVFWATDWLTVKKKVFTASQVLESDSNGQPTSAAKGTAYNKNFGTGATDIPTWNSVVLLTWDQTVNGIKTFPSSPIVPSPSAWTHAVNRNYVDALIWQYNNWTTTKDASDASTTQNIAHGLSAAPNSVRITAVCEATGGGGDSIPAISMTTYNWTTQSSVSFYASGGASFSLGWATVWTTFTLNIDGVSGTQTWVVTVTSTNIVITWTKTNSPTGVYTLLWEAQI